jgi:hypothetical protein
MASSAASSAVPVPDIVPDKLKLDIIARMLGKHWSPEDKKRRRYEIVTSYDYEYHPYNKNIINIYRLFYKNMSPTRSLTYQYNIKTGQFRGISLRPNGKYTTRGPESFAFLLPEKGERPNNRGKNTNKILEEYEKKLAAYKENDNENAKKEGPPSAKRGRFDDKPNSGGGKKTKRHKRYHSYKKSHTRKRGQ